jgi:hypothetical protein
MADTVKRGGRGCLFYGAIAFVLVLIGVMVGIYFGARTAARAAVAKYTATAPVQLPRLNISAAEEERVAEELARTAQEAASGQGVGEVVLTEQQLNVLLGQSAQVKPFREHLYLQPEGDVLKAQMSLPLDQFEEWKAFTQKIGARELTNRYLNGTAFLELSVTNGGLQMSITNLVVNNETLPAQFTSRLRSQNFAENANNSPELQAALQKVEDIEVKDGRVVIEFKK